MRKAKNNGIFPVSIDDKQAALLAKPAGKMVDIDLTTRQLIDKTHVVGKQNNKRKRCFRKN